MANGTANGGAAANVGAAGVSGGVQPGLSLQGSGDCDGRPCSSVYTLRAVYFNAERYRSKADCLTAAYTARVPLDLCR